MNFLPIVDRELRVAARRRTTYRVRMGFVLATSAFSALLLLAGNSASGAWAGSTVFWSLATVALAFCLMAGPRYAADALSEEKREGTLGLLWLTDLRGHHIVLGKLLAAWAQTIQGLLAFFPVLSVALLLGGVTAGEFWRTTGVLLNALFLSLSVGLLVSTVSRKAHRAITGAVFVLLIQLLIPPALEALLPQKWMSGLSPLVSLKAAAALAYAADPGGFWKSLGIAHLCGWSYLLLAGAALPHSWQERASRPEPLARVQQTPLRPGPPSRIQARTRLLDSNPICWLASRHEGQRWLLWSFTALATASAVVVFLLQLQLGHPFGIDFILGLVLTIALKLWVAWRACATLAEARRNGAIELLLATPLTVDEIIRGHWQALQRFFFWPTVGALLLGILPIAQNLLLQSPKSPENFLIVSVPILIALRGATLILDLLAIAWVGMWMGLTQPKPIRAFFRTVLIAIVLPILVFCVPNLVLDLFWISWARRKLVRHFREAAARQYAPVDVGLPTRLPALAQPPVITQVPRSNANDASA